MLYNIDMENNQIRPFKVAVTYGRFNLLHKGHLDLFRRMQNVADKIVIGISSSDKNKDIKKRMRVINRAMETEAPDINYVIVPSKQPFEAFDVAAGIGEQDVIAFFGHDQASLANAAEKYFGWEWTTIDRLTSSTAIRGHIDNEEWDILPKLVPLSILKDVIALHLS